MRRPGFNEAAAELEAAVAELGDPTPPGDAIWEESAVMYVRFLSAVLVTADRRLSNPEYRALAEYHNDGANFHEEMELSRHFSGVPLLDRAPAFLLEAWERDPLIARRIRDAIHHLVAALVDVDGEATDEENRVGLAYLNLPGLAGGPHS